MLFHGNSKFKQDKTGMIALLDRRHPRRIHTRYFNPMIPCCPKIFLCNEHESVFGNDPETGGHLSVQRRIHHFNVDMAWKKCYEL